MILIKTFLKTFISISLVVVAEKDALNLLFLFWYVQIESLTKIITELKTAKTFEWFFYSINKQSRANSLLMEWLGAYSSRFFS